MNDSSHLRHNQATKRNRVLRSEHQFSFPAQPLFGTYIGKFDLQFDLVSRCYLLRPEKKKHQPSREPLKGGALMGSDLFVFYPGPHRATPINLHIPASFGISLLA